MKIKAPFAITFGRKPRYGISRPIYVLTWGLRSVLHHEYTNHLLTYYYRSVEWAYTSRRLDQ